MFYLSNIKKEGCVFDLMNSKSRFYHNDEHLVQMFNELEKHKESISLEELEEIELAIIYHDVIYDINRALSKSKNILSNEIMSANYFMENYNGSLSKQRKIKVSNLIKLTATPNKAKTHLEKLFIFLDFSSILYDIEFLKKTSYSIFKEYQKLNFTEYQNGRRDFCKNIGPMIVKEIFNNDKYFNKYYEGFLKGFKMLELINDIFKPKIGIYAGSFKPFHIGHNNVLEKAEKIFDKIIIVSAIKKGKEDLIPYNIPNNLETYIDTSFKPITTILKEIELKNLNTDISIVRGIRNDYDLIEEQNYDQVLKDMGNKLPIIHILSDRKYSHVSSSLIRELQTLSGNEADRYIKF